MSPSNRPFFALFSAAGKKRPRSRKPREEEIEEESDEEEEESADEEELDASCQKCGQSDHPEWILLCDRCDIGWHASCLKPPLMVIPEGDWFCPPCDHVRLHTFVDESTLSST